MANLDQIIAPEILVRNFFNKHGLKPLFYSWFDKHCFLTNLDQRITPQKAKLGPDNNSTAYIQYIYIYAVKLKTGPRFPFL